MDKLRTKNERVRCGSEAWPKALLPLADKVSKCRKCDIGEYKWTSMRYGLVNEKTKEEQ